LQILTFPTSPLNYAKDKVDLLKVFGMSNNWLMIRGTSSRALRSYEQWLQKTMSFVISSSNCGLVLVSFFYICLSEKKLSTALQQLIKSSRLLKSIYDNASIKLYGLGLLIIIKKCPYDSGKTTHDITHLHFSFLMAKYSVCKY
jgi:hypothetical protein